MDLPENAAQLLDQVDVLRHASDLDLLVFFARHPRTLMASEQIAAFLGYGVKDVATSLEVLVSSGFIIRTPHRRHVARMYVLSVTPPGDGWVHALTELASTRAGRLALIAGIRQRAAYGTGGPPRRGDTADGVMPPPLQFPQGRAADAPTSHEPTVGRDRHDARQSGDVGGEG